MRVRAWRRLLLVACFTGLLALGAACDSGASEVIVRPVDNGFTVVGTIGNTCTSLPAMWTASTASEHASTSTAGDEYPASATYTCVTPKSAASPSSPASRRTT